MVRIYHHVRWHMNAMKYFSFWLCVALAPLNLAAEIELLTVKWTALNCLDACTRTVINQFRRLGGTAELIVSQQGAQASVRWKPYAPFRVDAIVAVMSSAGLRSSDIRVRVRGTIMRSGRALVLRSLGDNTMFILLGPAEASMTRYVPENSLDAHPLSPEMTQQLLAAERDSVVTVIEGPLFTPMRQAGIYLIIERATFNRLGEGAIPGH
jgi:hypothetical protein